MKIKLAVIGSRSFNDYDLLKKSILAHYDIKTIECIVSGGAIGADSFAEKFAKEFKIPTKIYLPNWELYGRAAGFRRNQEIINKATEVMAFWNGTSRGTKNSMDLADDQDKPVIIVYF